MSFGFFNLFKIIRCFNNLATIEFFQILHTFSSTFPTKFDVGSFHFSHSLLCIPVIQGFSERSFSTASECFLNTCVLFLLY